MAANKSEKFFLFGVLIDDVSPDELLSAIGRRAQERPGRRLATVNPDILLRAEADENYRRILDDFDWRVPDGVAVTLAAYCRGFRPRRLSGADLLPVLLRHCERKKHSVYFICRGDGLTDWKFLRRVLKEKYPRLKVDGGDYPISVLDEKKLDAIEADLLICNFGAPHQEKLISEIPDKNFGLAVGIGGAVDFLSGKLKRAPGWLRRLGLEWLWRTAVQPKRIGKMLRSVVIFPLHVLRDCLVKTK